MAECDGQSLSAAGDSSRRHPPRRRGSRSSAAWPQTPVLEATAPANPLEELVEENRRVIYVGSVNCVKRAGGRFAERWRLRCPAVVGGLEKVGDSLFTFLRLALSQWEALRTTNALKRLNQELRRRMETQASLPGQDAVLLNSLLRRAT